MANICCIGSAHPDNILTFYEPPLPRHTGMAKTTCSIGGVAYNIAVLLRELGNTVAMAGILGKDANGINVLNNMQIRDINSDAMLLSNYSTASYTAFLDPDGEMVLSAIDMQIYNQLTVADCEKFVPQLLNASCWLIDSNFVPEVGAYLADVAVAYNIPVYLAITSIFEADKLIPLLPSAAALFGNAAEIIYLANEASETKVDMDLQNFSINDIWNAIEKLHALGTQQIFCTNGPDGVYVLSNGKRTHCAANPVTKIISVNGAGDSFAAATIHTLLAGGNLENAIRAGLVAAALHISGYHEQIPAALEQFKPVLFRNRLRI